MKGELKLAAVMAAKGDMLKFGYEDGGRLRITYRKQCKTLPVIAGTNMEEFERLKKAVHDKMVYWKEKTLRGRAAASSLGP